MTENNIPGMIGHILNSLDDLLDNLGFMFPSVAIEGHPKRREHEKIVLVIEGILVMHLLS